MGADTRGSAEQSLKINIIKKSVRRSYCTLKKASKHVDLIILCQPFKWPCVTDWRGSEMQEAAPTMHNCIGQPFFGQAVLTSGQNAQFRQKCRGGGVSSFSVQ